MTCVGIAALILLIAGALAWIAAQRAGAASGLPAGRLIAADTSHWLPAPRLFFSDTWQLSGRPDYLIRDRHGLIPVEIKSSRAPGRQPRRGHLLQLAAYCLLVSETEGKRPSRGLIKYADATFEVEFTPALERQLLDTLEAMRRDLARGRAQRNHHDAGRCKSCGYRHACDERLA